MKYSFNRWWFGPLMFILAGLSINPLFTAAGLPLPLSLDAGIKAFYGMTIYLIMWCGITVILGTVLSFILVNVFPQYRSPKTSM
ncbi:hypothetical protein [Collimonas humicola]|uniref:hypothetical protein n=1 Tax=Collimonas humicola TaxID=2825886 RepID=UPI001B8AEEFE|nr:hypothetical protein [Collimonas humicola]